MELHFPPQFIQWTMVCVSSTSYSLSINGGIHGLFEGKKGLRQGPVSLSLCDLSGILLQTDEGEDLEF